MTATDMPELKTERLRVRRLTLEDGDAIRRLFTGIGWVDETASDEENDARWKAWLTWTVQNYVQLARLHQPPYGERAIVLEETSDVVGVVGLVPSFDAFGQLPFFGGVIDAPRSPEVGLFWALARESQGHGYATEAARAMADYAFRTLDLARVVATTEYENEASISVMHRLGMRIERNPQPTPKPLQIVGVLERPERA